VKEVLVLGKQGKRVKYISHIVIIQKNEEKTRLIPGLLPPQCAMHTCNVWNETLRVFTLYTAVGYHSKTIL
jgi:hypothetical protein